MAEQKQFNKWDMPVKELRNITPIKIRNLIVECFYVAQGGTFKKIKQLAKTTFTDTDILNTTTAVVKIAFLESGGDFDKPTKEILTKVIEFLAVKAASWGTPKDIIEHHKSQIKQAIDFLK